MASHPYASTKLKTRKKAAAKNAVARTAQAMQKLGLPTMVPVGRPAAPSSPELLACISQAKHQRLTEMLRDLRAGAEALSANADSLLSRLS